MMLIYEVHHKFLIPTASYVAIPPLATFDLPFLTPLVEFDFIFFIPNERLWYTPHAISLQPNTWDPLSLISFTCT